MSEQGIEEFEKKIAPDLALFIYQPVSGARIGERLAASSVIEHIPTTCVKLSFQYLHFEGYTPFVNYPDRSMGRSPFDYVDYRLVNAFLRGLTVDEAVEQANSPILDRTSVTEVLDWATAELRQRENGDTGPVDIALTDFIVNQFYKINLFHTINHPTGAIFDVLSDKVIESLIQNGCLQSTSDDRPRRASDPLASTHFPCNPEIYIHSGCSFAEQPLRYNRRRITYTQLASRTFSYLADERRVSIELSLNNLMRKRPWFGLLV